MEAAAYAIALQTDEILVKPMELSALVNAIAKRLSNEPSGPRAVEIVAIILARSVTE